MSPAPRIPTVLDHRAIYLSYTSSHESCSKNTDCIGPVCRFSKLILLALSLTVKQGNQTLNTFLNYYLYYLLFVLFIICIIYYLYYLLFVLFIICIIYHLYYLSFVLVIICIIYYFTRNTGASCPILQELFLLLRK